MAVDPEIAPFLISSWWCSFLYMAEVFALYYYCSTFWRRDRWWLKTTVLVAFGVDTIGIIFQLMEVHYYILFQWTNMTVMTTIAAAFAQGTNAFIVQTLLSWRVWTMSKNVFVSGVLFTVSLASYAGIWGLSFREIFHNKYSDVPSYKPYFIVWLSCSVAADVLIALSIVVLLNRMNTSFRPTRNLIQRIIMLTIGTGSVTAIIAATMLMDYLLIPVSNYAAIGMPLGRLYTLNVFVILLSRNTPNQGAGSAYTASASGTAVNVINMKGNAQHHQLTSTGKTTHGVEVETMQYHHMDDYKLEQGLP